MKLKKMLPLLTAVLLLLSLTACKGSGDGKNTTADGTTAPKADHYHEYKDHVFEPTCVAGGKTSHTCHICGYTYMDAEVPALGHSYTDVVTAPTCSTGGYTTHTCTVCGHTYRDAETPIREHAYLPEVVAPTCTAEGYTKHTCVYCLDSYTDTPTAKVAHDYRAEVIEPTGTAQGYTEHTCAVCGDSYRDSYTETVTGNTIVNFDINGGTMEGYAVRVYRAGEHVELPIPTLEGHRFDGWHIHENEEEILVESGIWSSTTDVWLVAHWSPIQAELTLHMGEGGISLAYGYRTFTWGQPLGTLPTPTAKFGYVFDGWYDGDTRLTPDMISRYTEPVTLEGRWFAPLAAAHVSGGDGNDYDWAVYHDGTLRFHSDWADIYTGEQAPFTIADGTFRGMSEIVRVEMPETVTDVGNYAFADCPNLKTAIFPGSARVIRSSVFEGCGALESITVGSGISVINEDAFKGCSSLTTLTLPLSLFQIYDPFGECTSLREIRYEGTAFQWSVIVKDPAAKSALGELSYTYEVAYSQK